MTRSLGDYDLAVVGSGIAGLYAAIRAHEEGHRVLLVTKGSIDEASTRYAQGGIAAAVGSGDDVEIHLRDTIKAGAGLVDEQAARIMVTEAAARIADLVRFGVRFDVADASAGHGMALGREAAHSTSRILHAGGDSTGLEIELSLSSLARRTGVTIFEHTLAERLLVENDVITGIETLGTNSGCRSQHEVGKVVLATGGAGQLYLTTTNPDIATGDGIALAYQAGAEVMDLEFTQFHPTAMSIPGQPVFLISEAVRGEGALIYNVHHERFLPRVDERAELAPRDVVALAIHREMSATGSDHVLLDITSRNAEWLATRFPQIYRTCLEAGFDMATDRIPVLPAAHYTMGGVRTSSWGETTLHGLYAVGEVACTAVHGANRLASNSLLETVVFAHRAVERMWALPDSAEPLVSSLDAVSLAEPNPADEYTPTVDELRALMGSHVGIERDAAGLVEATRTLAQWSAALGSSSDMGAPDRAAYELRSLVLCGWIAAEAALAREESRGAHYRTDFPDPLTEWQRHLVFQADPTAKGVFHDEPGLQ